MQHGDYENFTLKNLDDISPACHISPGTYDFLIDMQRQRTKKGRTVFHIKYSDTDAMFDRQVKNALRKFGIPEDVIQQQTFKYG